MIQYAIDNPDLFPDPFPEDSDEEDNGDDDGDVTDDEGDVGIHGLEYLDEEELNDGPEGKYGRATDDTESESSDKEAEKASEGEEEEMDHDFVIEEDDYSADEEQN
jgi:hypothetical protein